MQSRILIIGSGLLGVKLNSLFRLNGFDTRITIRRHSLDNNNLILWNKDLIKNELVSKYGGIQCDTINEYKALIQEFEPNFIVNTIPQPKTDLLKYLLTIDNCFKIDFSSPASDFAKSFPNKCPPGSYPGDKLQNEILVNQRALIHQDALTIQIGFIPELTTIEDRPNIAGLSFETMVSCNLLTGQHDELLEQIDELDNTGLPILKTALSKFDRTKGFTCTPISNIFVFLRDIFNKKIVIPNKIFGRTLAMHSSQVWSRNEIINVSLEHNNYVGNNSPSFYGQKSEDQITKPVHEFLEVFFSYSVPVESVIDAIKNSSKVFWLNKEVLTSIALVNAKKN